MYIRCSATLRAARRCVCWLVCALLLLPCGTAVARRAPSAPSIAAAPTSADAPLSPELHEEWTGNIYASSFRAGVCIAADGKARGVLLLKVPTGKVDVYHFYGQQGKDGTITLQHPSGHRFTGRFTDASTIEGKVKLKNGFKVTLRGDRRHDAPLRADTCRPLDEQAATTQP